MDFRPYIDVGAVLHIGRQRQNNEDSILIYPSRGCFAVADGMGGGDAGELASKMMIEALKKQIDLSPSLPAARENAVFLAAWDSNKAIGEHASARTYTNMGTTVVALLLNPWNPKAAAIFHAGDSRTYCFRGCKIRCLTRDHNMLNINNKYLHHSVELQNILCNAVGVGRGFFLERTDAEILLNDIYILCSDGMFNMVKINQLKEILETNTFASSQNIANTLLDASLKNGGKDNISIVVLKILNHFVPHIPSSDEIEADQYFHKKSNYDPSDTTLTS